MSGLDAPRPSCDRSPANTQPHVAPQRPGDPGYVSLVARLYPAPKYPPGHPSYIAADDFS